MITKQRGTLPRGTYFICIADLINNPSGAQEYFVDIQGRTQLFFHGKLGGDPEYAEIPLNKLVIPIRP